MANRIVHFEIEAKDKERAKKFYSSAFGWEMMQQGQDMGDYVVVMTDKMDSKNPGINGGMFQAEGEKKFNAYRCIIGVDDIDKSISDVKAAGGKVTGEKTEIPGVGMWALCEDTEGNIFGILQPYPGEWMPKP